MRNFTALFVLALILIPMGKTLNANIFPKDLKGEAPTSILENAMFALFEEEIEQEMKLEAWMLDFSSEVSVEVEQEVEDWMLETNSFIESNEEEVKIEAWMLDFSAPNP